MSKKIYTENHPEEDDFAKAVRLSLEEAAATKVAVEEEDQKLAAAIQQSLNIYSEKEDEDLAYAIEDSFYENVESEALYRKLVEMSQKSTPDQQMEAAIELSIKNDVQSEYLAQDQNNNQDGATSLNVDHKSGEAALKVLERQIKSAEESLECPVCLETPKSPIFQCGAGHLICSECKPRMKMCPICKAPYKEPALRNRFAETSAEKLEKMRQERENMMKS